MGFGVGSRGYILLYFPHMLITKKKMDLPIFNAASKHPRTSESNLTEQMLETRLGHGALPPGPAPLTLPLTPLYCTKAAVHKL